MKGVRTLRLALLVLGVASLTLSQEFDDAGGTDEAYEDNDNSLDTGGHTCICVPSYQCLPDNTFNTNGEGIFDVRARTTDDTVYDVPYGECPQVDEDNPMVCCNIPKPSAQTQHRQCGIKGGSSLVNLPGMVRIQGGADLSFGELPWMLALMKVADNDDVPSIKCGASLIHPQVALTAAHCVAKDLDETHYIVRAGEYDTSGEVEALPHQDLSVIEIVMPNNYNSGALYHDYALIHLDKPVTLSEHIGLICLPELNDFFNGNGCMASGWGRDSVDGKPNTLLRKVDLGMVNRERCQKDLRKSRLGRFFILDPSFVCAQGMNDADTCEGDGGSPLVCPLSSDPTRWVQVGITAWGIGCGSELPAVYANVAAGRNWIDQQLIQWGYSLDDVPEDVINVDEAIQDVFNTNEI